MQKQFRKSGRAFEVDKKGILKFARLHYKELVHLDSGTWNGRYVQTIRQKYFHVDVIPLHPSALDFVPESSNPTKNSGFTDKFATPSKPPSP